MSMPLALSFMLPSPCPLPRWREGVWGSLMGRGAGADLSVRAIAAGLIVGRRLELPLPDAARRRLDGVPRGHQAVQRGRVPPGEAGLEEAQLHPRGQPPGHLVLGQRVDLELESLPRALVRLLLVGDVARLVVDDHETLGRLVDPVEAPADPVEAEVEPELALHVGGLLPGGLLLVVEAGQRRHSRPLALLLVLAGEKALVPPRVVERAQEVLERGVVAGRAAAQVELDRVVERAAVDDRVVLPARLIGYPDVLVLQR